MAAGYNRPDEKRVEGRRDKKGEASKILFMDTHISKTTDLMQQLIAGYETAMKA